MTSHITIKATNRASSQTVAAVELLATVLDSQFRLARKCGCLPALPDLLSAKVVLLAVDRNEEILGTAIYRTPNDLVGPPVWTTLRKHLSFPRSVLCLPLIAGFRKPAEPDAVILDFIAVSTEHQHEGVGSLLLREVITEADTKSLPVLAEVPSTNRSALRFYDRHGFHDLGLLFAPLQKPITGFAVAHRIMRAVSPGEDPVA
ncbi:MAG: GNAT family N-acetyltransferase [Chloroflexi bacterium]|nr:GNAT family N-acetyltransferase [Chloroflexota bacterium]